MTIRYRFLTGVALGAALTTMLALPAAADSDRAAWIRSLQEAREARTGTVTTAATRPTSTTAARASTASASASASSDDNETLMTYSIPQFREVGGRLVPVDPTEGFQPVAVSRSAGTQTRRISRQMDPKFLPTEVSFSGYSPGTIVIDTEDKFLYLVQPGGMAKRYGVGVGRPGFQWAGTHRVSMKREWPGWTPPPQMRKRQPELPAYMEGGPENPLGARAMYLGSTLYRIHGSNAPWTIGHEVSSGCIRMRNEDVIDLYAQVPVGTKVVVLR